MNKKIIIGTIAIIALILMTMSATALDLTKPNNYTVNLGDSVNFQLTHDYPAGNVTYTVTGGGTIDATETYSWTPTSNDEGNNTITIFAANITDSDDNDTETFNVEVLLKEGTFGADSIELGSEDQERNTTITKTWIVTNTGDKTINNIAIETTGNSEDYELTATGDKTTLSPGENLTVTISTRIPWTQNSGRESIGTIKLTSTNADDYTNTIYLTTETKLYVKATFERTEGSDKSATSDRSIDLEPFEDVSMIIEVENRFSDRGDTEDFEIRNIRVKIDSREIDEIDNQDEDLSDLDPEELDEVTFDFSMDPNEVDFNDEPYEIDIEVTGTDINGATHTTKFTITINLDRENEDIRFDSITTSKSFINCDETSVYIDFTLYNVGTRNLDDAMVRVEIDGIDARTYLREIELDEGEDSEFRVRYDFPEDEELEDGLYYMDLRAYPDGADNEYTDTDTIELEVRGCSTTQDTDDDKEDTKTDDDKTTVVTTPPTVPATTGQPVSTSTGSKIINTSSNGYLIALGVIVLVLIIMVAGLLVVILKK
ncbi:hypothetical protein K9L97_03735 [Candidatus Woesearchaeota archaeon]|nr:hypothetical protein [Candidatus Woesearchaeota archaeon]